MAFNTNPPVTRVQIITELRRLEAEVAAKAATIVTLTEQNQTLTADLITVNAQLDEADRLLSAFENQVAGLEEQVADLTKYEAEHAALQTYLNQFAVAGGTIPRGHSMILFLTGCALFQKPQPALHIDPQVALLVAQGVLEQAQVNAIADGDSWRCWATGVAAGAVDIGGSILVHGEMPVLNMDLSECPHGCRTGVFLQWLDTVESDGGSITTPAAMSLECPDAS